MVEIRYDTAVFVMGMHRSGTSALARILMLLHGDSPAQVLEASNANLRGFWESPEINSFNQTLLADRGANWHEVSPLEVHVATTRAADLNGIRRVAASQFAVNSRPIIKDPRICRLAPLWIAALKDQTRELVFPFILRNPIEVATSLNERNKFPPALGLNLWIRHYLDAENATRAHKRGLVHYDALLADWRMALRTLQDRLQIDLRFDTGSQAVDAFLTPDLRHQKVSSERMEADLAEFPMVLELWDLMNEWSVNGELRARDRQRMDRLRNDFDRIGLMMNTVLEEQRVLEKRRLEDKKAKNSEIITPDPTSYQISELREEQATAFRGLRDGLAVIISDLGASRHADALAEEARRQIERERMLLREDNAREIAALTRTIESAVARESDWRARVKDVSEMRDAALEQAKVAHSRLAQLTMQLHEMAPPINADEANETALPARTGADADSTYEDAQRAVAGLKSAIAAMRDREVDLRSTLTASRGELLEVIRERDGAFDTLAEARDAIAMMQSEKVGLLAESTALRGALEAERRASITLQDQAGSLRFKVEAAEQERVAAHEETAALREEIVAVRADLKSVTRKYRATQATLARTKAGLDHAKTRLSLFKELSERTQHDLELARSTWAYRLAHGAALLWVKILASLGTLRGTARRRRRDAAETIIASGLFDPAWYLERYPDVADGTIEPLQHFVRFGWKELRDPGPDFSASRYLRENPDVAQAGLNPVLHYIEFGQVEGRSTHKSKHAQRPIGILPAFAPAAPVYAAPFAIAQSSAAGAEPTGLIAPLPALFADVVEACGSDAKGTAAAARFMQMSRLASYAPDAWTTAAHDGCLLPADAWYLSDTLLRIRWRAEGEKQDCHVIVCQYDPSAREAVALDIGIAHDAALLDVPLRSPCHPLLVTTFASSGTFLNAFVIAFPSLMRGGIHHADFLSEIARPAGSNVSHPLSHSAVLAKRLASIQLGDAAPAISRIAVDMHDAIGTGPLFDPLVRAWLRDVFELPIETANEADGPGEAGRDYLATTIGQAGSPRNTGGTLVVRGDDLPSISILCATIAADELGDARTCLPLSEAFVNRDASQPSFAFILPPVPLLTSASAAIPHFRAQSRIVGGHVPRQPLPAASIAVASKSLLHDAELLFPISSAEVISRYRPTGIRLIVHCENASRDALDRTLNALAMQDCAHAIAVTFIGDADGETLEQAGRLFDGRIETADTWKAALARCNEPFCGVLMAGIVLHDGRSLGVLCDLVASGAASACCSLVSSSKLGKGWTVKVVANGLFPETPRGAYMESQIVTSATLWRRTYPVRQPIQEFWLTSTAKFAKWAEADVHQLAREDGEHWCTTLTTASLIATGYAPSFNFETPVADPACFTSVRVLNG